MTENIKELTALVEEQSKSLRGEVQYAYVAGYYESMLSRLAADVPEVAEFLQLRVYLLSNQKKAA